MKYMLDTNVLMHFANDKWKRGKIEKHLDRIGRENTFISSITIHEVHTKLIKAKVSKRNIDALYEFLNVFAVRNFNTGAAIESAKIRAALENSGDPIGDRDMLLAGHAKYEKATLVTNNTKHFKLVYGLKIEDWIND
jgi:tRNA(fMet)-specific endonuclease VapC